MSIQVWRLAAVFAFALGSAASATAQAPPSDKELKQFVAASVEVNRINQSSLPEQEKAPSPEAASKLEDEAGTRMEKAVTGRGLTTQRFTEIYEVMQSDPKVRARIIELAKQQK